ncbi:MAG: D-alanine--D-alanine ligase [Oscillospiraceae bacterium]|nr:D-alanine--D-alanine ligase [Oscillospiraceae bacterium]
MKPTVAVIFGGKSTEHEVSIITGLQAFAAINRDKYNAVPIYLSKDNKFYTGEIMGKIENYSNISDLLKSKGCIAVTFCGADLCEITPKKVELRKPVATIDIALPCVHGTNVEDGALQGYLQTHGIPYAGCDVTASAIGMDKAFQKAVLKQFAGVPVLDCLCFTAKQFVGEGERVLDEILRKLELPLIVKPINLGSSIGIKAAKTEKQLTSAIEHALLFADTFLVEKAITNLKEINCSVIGDKDSARASECEEPISSGNESILGFDDKYSGGKGGDKSGGTGIGSKGSGMASLKRKIPADISPELKENIQAMAVRAFRTLGCSGVARIDFLLDTESGQCYFNEINTIPGSLAFYLWEPVGVKYPALLDEILSLALKREREKSNLNYSFENNILSAFKGGMGSKSINN